jgi:hypothetical protein
VLHFLCVCLYLFHGFCLIIFFLGLFISYYISLFLSCSNRRPRVYIASLVFWGDVRCIGCRRLYGGHDSSSGTGAAQLKTCIIVLFRPLLELCALWYRINDKTCLSHVLFHVIPQHTHDNTGGPTAPPCWSVSGLGAGTWGNALLGTPRGARAGGPNHGKGEMASPASVRRRETGGWV